MPGSVGELGKVGPPGPRGFPGKAGDRGDWGIQGLAGESATYCPSDCGVSKILAPLHITFPLNDGGDNYDEEEVTPVEVGPSPDVSENQGYTF